MEDEDPSTRAPPVDSDVDDEASGAVDIAAVRGDILNALASIGSSFVGATTTALKETFFSS